jgi:DNA invertase Pin-like site-specific DNA recombinase
MRGLALGEVVVDGDVSASQPLDERRGGRQLKDAIAKGANHVVCLKLDRLFRNAEEALRETNAWDMAGVSLHLIDMGGASFDTSSAIGRMLFLLMAGFAEMERNLAAERTKVALAHKKSQGEKTGGEVPYGWRLKRDGVHLKPHAKEQAIIKAARELKEKGLSLRRIGARLAEQGHLPRKGKAWHPETISNLLAAEVAEREE